MQPSNNSSQTNTHPNNLCSRGKQHYNLPVIMICLEKQCAHRRKCCLTCVDQLHRKHQVVSINRFTSYVSQILHHNSMLANRNQVMELIDKSANTFKMKIEEIRQKFSHKIDEVQNRMNQYFQTIKDSFISQNHETKIKQLYQDFTDSKVNEIYIIAKETQMNLVQSTKEIQSSMNTTLKLLDSKASGFHQQVQKYTSVFNKIIHDFKITGAKANKTIYFNEQTKADNLIIGQNKRSVKRGEGTGGYPIVLINQPFSELFNEISVKITEEPDKKGMWLGVCVKQIVKNFNYKSCYGLSKGTWAIDQVGINHNSAYSWSHHDSNFNSTPKVGWQFNLGDVVTVSVDFDKSKVIFKRDSDIYEQPIKTDLGPIYAFVGPTNLGDTFQLV